MQIKVIFLFIASYLVISTVAAPTTLTPEEAFAAVRSAGDEKVGEPYAEEFNNPVKGVVNGVPIVGSIVGGLGGGGLGGGAPGGGALDGIVHGAISGQ
jgi:hypothetical protein